MTSATQSPPGALTNYDPILVGDHFVIAPPATGNLPASRRVLRMARGAFGSGDHETTRSCLEILATLPPLTRPKILDLGSGSGILTIAALQLFGGHAWCVDIDQGAVACARTNCSLNHVDAVNHHCGVLDSLAETGFNLILANIYGDILLDVAAQLVERAEPGALFLLSGILWEDNYDVRATYRKLGCEVQGNRFLDEFSTVVLKKQVC